VCVPTDNAKTVQLAYVIDGDTIRTNLGTVRLVGIDTPEKGEPGYEEAKLVLTLLLDGKITLVQDVNYYDKYHRMLRYVLVDGEDAGAIMIQTGHAVPMAIEPDISCRSYYEEIAR
jgi:endonuclease YncB( thermonuclease family)